MEKKKKLIGDRKLIKNAILHNISGKLIRSFYNLTKSQYKLYKYTPKNPKIIIKTEIIGICFDTKRIPYYTEEEMIEGIPKYKFRDLSKEEKQFYYKYNKQIKNGERTN